MFSPHIEISQLIYTENHLSGFYMNETFADNGLNLLYTKIVIIAKLEMDKNMKPDPRTKFNYKNMTISKNSQGQHEIKLKCYLHFLVS